MKKYLILILASVFLLTAETLFQVKDSLDRVVLDVSTDGLRVYNEGDLLMEISSSDIRAFIEDNPAKGLARSFSVTTSTNVKGQANVLEVTTDATQLREGNQGQQYTDFSPENIFLGINAGLNTTPNSPIEYDGRKNLFLGNEAGLSNVSGRQNIYIGNEAGYSNVTSHFSTFVGSNAGRNSMAGNNTFVGNSTGFSNVSGSANSVFGDFASLQNVTGQRNSILGHAAGAFLSAGDNNTLMGYYAGGGVGTEETDSFNNSLFGSEAGKIVTGNNNVMIGRQSGFLNAEGSGNIFLGHKAGYNETGSNRLYIDNSQIIYPLIFGKFDSSRMVVIDGNAGDNPNNRKLFVWGEAGGTTAWYNDSDKRLKKSIKTIDSATEKVMKLRGVHFEWDGGERYQKGSSIGFIAQEAIEVIPELVDHNKENDSYGMQYAPITALLVEAFKEQKYENDQLRNTVLDQEKRIAELEGMIEKILDK